MDLIKEKWEENDFVEFRHYLFSLQDKKYQAFHNNLITKDKQNYDSKVIGVRLPIIDEIVKKIKKGSIDSFLNIKPLYYEEIMIKGLLIGQINDFNIMINHLNDFLPLIDNWAICDSTMLKNRCFKKNFNLGIEFVEKCLISNKEFTIRAGIDLLIAFYINDNYIDYVLKKVVEVKFDAYYVKMALAWLVSICFIKYPDKTNILIVNEMLDKFTHNKAISKICDSYRVDQEVKDKLKTYRIKTI